MRLERKGMGNYQDKNKIGGKINSKIDNQDSFASVISVEQLNESDIFGFGCKIDDFCIKCEGDEDVEIFNNEDHIYIQVKSSQIRKGDFVKILDRFIEIDSDEKATKNYFVIATFEKIVIDNKDIIEQFDDYYKVFINEYETNDKKKRVRNELIERFGLQKYSVMIDRIRFKYRPLFRDAKDTVAIFSKTLRLYYKCRGISEDTINELFASLNALLGVARRERGSVSRGELEKIINKELSHFTPFSKLSLQMGYKKIENGYIKDEEANSKITSISRGFRKAKQKLFAGWRKAYFKEFLLSFFIGAKSCPQCGHPMMANINGLKGIACPDCGFTPYVTMLAFCECGYFETIKNQPEIDDEAHIRYIRDYFNGKEDNLCPKCGRYLYDDNFEDRVFYAPIPYPYSKLMSDDEMYKDSLY